MKKHSVAVLARLLGFYAVLAGLSLATSPARAFNQVNMGLNFQYSKGNPQWTGAPMFGYGGAAGSFGALNGCFGPGGFMGGGMGMGMGGAGFGSTLPALPPLIPPHMQGGGFLGGGGGFGGSPYLPGNSACAMYCQPTYAYGAPQLMGPVQGGPMIGGGLMAGGGMIGGSGAASAGSNVYSISGHGTTVIDMRKKNEDNSGEVIWAAALGMGMQAPNVFPFVGPRNGYTNLGPFFYQEGPRDWTLQPRPHAAP
jgi:hypothetical protein